MAKFGTNTSDATIKFISVSYSYRVNTLGPMCLWQCFNLDIRHTLMLESTLVALSVIRIFLLAKVLLIFCIYDYI